MAGVEYWEAPWWENINHSTSPLRAERSLG